jgi:preprotein translocase subunit YajC
VGAAAAAPFACIKHHKGRDDVEPGLANLVFLAFLILIFYFMLIRPQRRRVDQHRKLISSIGVGDEVVTIGGIYGIVGRMGDDDVELEISPGTTIRVVKSAIARRVTQDEETGDDTAADEETGDDTAAEEEQA